MPDTEINIGLDVGRTIRGALVRSDGTVLLQHRVESEVADPRIFVGQLIDVIKLLLAHHPARAAGIGWAGLVNQYAQRIEANPNLIDVSPFDVRGELDRATGMQIVLDNDANVAAYGEWKCGAARGSSNAFFVTIGTGIGAGLILGGQLQRGARGFAGEFGHFKVEMEGLECACGSSGCLETLASGPNIVRRVREKVFIDPAFSVSQLASDMEGTLTAQRVFEAAAAGDQLASIVLNETGGILGSAIASVINLLNVDVVVLGGGVMAEDNLLLDPIRNRVKTDAIAVSFEGCRIVGAELGPDAGIIGAALLAGDTITSS